MASVPKRHVALTSIPAIFNRTASGNRRIRRETPLVVPAAADLELCRRESDVPPSSRTRVKTRSAGKQDAAELQASLRAAYRPKPVAGGAYSVVITDVAITDAASGNEPGARRSRKRHD